VELVVVEGLLQLRWKEGEDEYESYDEESLGEEAFK
jgi:hypothetical protein